MHFKEFRDSKVSCSQDYSSDFLHLCRNIHFITRSMRRLSFYSSCQNLDDHCILEILSYLDNASVLKFGSVNKSISVLSKHPSLWTNVKIHQSDPIAFKFLSCLAQRTGNNLHLNILSVVKVGRSHNNFPNILPTAECCPQEGYLAPISSAVTQKSALLNSNIRKKKDSIGLCANCKILFESQESLRSLKELQLSKLIGFTECSFSLVLSICTKLVDISVNLCIDVNFAVDCISMHCPCLERISFLQIEKIGSEPDYNGNLLSYSSAERLAARCPELRTLKFTNYCLNEDSVSALVENTNRVEEADLSVHEDLMGNFLHLISTRWIALKSLTVRDCPQLNDSDVVAFVQSLCSQPQLCPNLSLLDFSCQWSYSNQSLLDDVTKLELRLRRPQIKWREDQCSIQGFGIDLD